MSFPLPVRVAVSMARKSEYSPYKLGACIVRGKRIISAGFNQIKTHPLTRRMKNIKGLHAEMHACIGVDADALHGATIYVARIRRDGSYGLAKPCLTCREFLANVGVKRAYFTQYNGELGVIKL